MQGQRAGQAAESIVKDLVAELGRRRWAERRDLVSRIFTVEQIALALREEGAATDGTVIVESYREGVVGQALAEALRRLGVRHPVCGDSAFVLSISADRRHRESAKAWFAANPEARGDGSRLLH